MNSFFSMNEVPRAQVKYFTAEKSKDPYTEETWEGIVRRILYLCRLKNMNLNTLAMRSGLTPSTLKSILYGKSKNPGTSTIRHICDGFNISLDEFFHSKLFREW